MTASSEEIVAGVVRESMLTNRKRPLIVGICGAQGSGKTTVVHALSKQFSGAPAFSLDDLYLPRRDRQNLAVEVHPLFATRGVPGTHDVTLGLGVLDALRNGERVHLPKFDKSIDDRVAAAQWPATQAGYEVAFFEGWCLGATPQTPAELAEPANQLEAEEDPDGKWRSYVNAQLAGPYKALFAKIDLLVFLAAPSPEIVFRWRREQELALRRSAPDAEAVMDDAALIRFVAHFERLTRNLLLSMPKAADLVLNLDENRQCVRFHHN